MVTTKLRLSGLMELIWWIITALVVMLILFPVFENVPEYPFWTYNIIFIALFISYTRYIFHLKHTWLAKLFWIKIIFIFTSIFNQCETSKDPISIEKEPNSIFQSRLNEYQYIENQFFLVDFYYQSVFESSFDPFTMRWHIQDFGKRIVQSLFHR